MGTIKGAKCFRLLREVCVPTERFTRGVRCKGTMMLPFRVLEAGREKHTPEALVLATAAAATSDLPGVPKEMNAVLKNMGFRTGSMLRMTGNRAKVYADCCGVEVEDARIAAYWTGGYSLLSQCRYVWTKGSMREILPEERNIGTGTDWIHYAATDHQGNLIYLGAIRISVLPERDEAAFDRLQMLRNDGIRVVMTRRPARLEIHPGLQVLCLDEQIPILQQEDFAQELRQYNHSIVRNRVIAAVVAGVLLVAVLISILL